MLNDSEIISMIISNNPTLHHSSVEPNFLYIYSPNVGVSASGIDINAQLTKLRYFPLVLTRAIFIT